MPTSAAQMANSAWVKMGIKPEYIEVEFGLFVLVGELWVGVNVKKLRLIKIFISEYTET